MNNFRLIAIKTGKKPSKTFADRKGVRLDFFKVLKADTLYQFDSNFKFDEDALSGALEIVYNPKSPINLFATSESMRPISISAIVGKNGSGKSSLLELLFVAVYNYSASRNILKGEKGENLDLVPGIDIEVFYLLENNIIKLKIDTLNTPSQQDGIHVIRFSDVLTKWHFKILTIAEEDKMIIEEFLFYTIGLNYSHYSLNSRYIGDWINSVFRKNDGYQTPIVLNPYREEGIIDINNEEYLTKSRLLANLLTYDEEIRFTELIKGKKATRIEFQLNPRKANFRRSPELQVLKRALRDNKTVILDRLFSTFLGSPFESGNFDYYVPNRYLITAYAYITKKLYTITQRYYPYTGPKYQFLSDYNSESNAYSSLLTPDGHVPQYNFDPTKLDYFLLELAKDNSHVTFKLRQAVYFVSNYSFFENFLGKFVSIESLAKELSVRKLESEQLVNIVPPSFFNVNIEFAGGGYFSELSSGEKQQIYTSTTYIYHLINLQSVNKTGLIKYSYVNLVFDEIELYYHPELQKSFIKDLLDNLSRLNIKNIKGVNCLFVTHSPFILSDIPASNILKLIEGNPRNDSEKTFGANVHDLLANDFFMDESIGDFAKHKIQDIITSLHKKKKDSPKKRLEIKGIIDIIGEPYIREQLIEMYYEKYPEEYNKELEIRQLEERLNFLKQ